MKKVKIQSYVEDKQREFLLISIKNYTMNVGKFYQLSMDFVGRLNDNLNGFYRSSYKENGVKKYSLKIVFISVKITIKYWISIISLEWEHNLL